MGAGAFIALLGVPAELVAIDNRNTFDSLIAVDCSSGCGVIPPKDQPYLDRMKADNALAISLFAVGGATIVSGVVAVLLNTPHAVIERPVVVIPTRGGAIASVGWKF
jgi:hypothetical protein